MENSETVKEEKEESIQNKTIKDWMNQIGEWFTKKREIERIRVVSRYNSFWVSNPKKIEWWKTFAERQSGALLLKKDNQSLPIHISKVIYKDGKN